MCAKRILITGAAGLIGSHILLRLTNQDDYLVRAVDFGKELRIRGKNISFVSADLSRMEQCKEVVKEIDFAIMFAAKIDRRPKNLSFAIANLTMNFQMMEAAYEAGVKKIVWLSSATGYPPLDRPAKEEEMFLGDPCNSNFAVGWMNRYLEIMCKMYATKLERKMSTIVFRPTAVYGEYGDFNPATCHVLPALVCKVAKRQNPLEIWGSGDTLRDFIYAGDVAAACLLAINRIEGHDVFNLGSGEAISIKELSALLIEIDHYFNAQIVYRGGDAKPAQSIQVNMKKAKDILGFSPRVSIREGLSKVLAWYKEQEIVNV
ncbi:MAG: nucleoside-diphosphate-sugar epimerase [Candidatus Saganbacteria bacterium]|uniref:Nucleoside-diphosphate-sugar epimerase n=1 Tax=Candidatus Saganbacteria bacterium TaxID=2575572 RepID=A0A833L2G4_UNCSA|nr:MAG: nucleoside-diphosphate-sugar epimerase [Candidatus Saganbacteria bacterium]